MNNKSNRDIGEYEKVFYADKHALHNQTCLDRWVNYKNYFNYRDAFHKIIKKIYLH